MMNYRAGVGDPTHLGVTKNGKDINFAVVVRDKKPCSLLLYSAGSPEPEMEIPFTEQMRFGDICAMKISGLSFRQYEYNYRIGEEIISDPYARALAGREVWGKSTSGPHEIRGKIELRSFAWQNDEPLHLPYQECVLYVTHPRGFTMDPSSKVRRPGTFAGIREKIPYLKRLGITQLELMPVYEFAEREQAKKGKKHKPIRKNAGERINYWGYGPACYFAPKASYSASGDPVREMKELVRELHKNGIELILEFYFPPRTDPNLIQDCIRYWVLEYHIDGVHVNSQGTPLTALALDPLLGDTRIMSEYFPMDQIYEDEYEPRVRILAEYNDDFLVKARRFLRGDEDMLWQITDSMRRNPAQFTVVNYMAGHNGFTLTDAVTYDLKHNEANREDNRDGQDWNYSCNYGAEGPVKDRRINSIRRRQIRNAFLILLLSQGIPAVYGGDEMGNSQMGNNNVYCQDNELSWIQWSRKKADLKMQQFVREAIAFRKGHPAFGRVKEYRMKDYLSKGMPDLSYHGRRAWYREFESYNRQVGILYAGAYTGAETLYVLYNMHTEEHELALPTLSEDQRWYVIADTGREDGVFSGNGELLEDQKMAAVPPQTILILEGRSYEAD